MSAPTPVVTTIRRGIVTAIQAVTAGSTYHNSLNGDDQVKHGLYAAPARTGLPCVMVGRGRIASQHGGPLGQYARTCVFQVVCWAPHTTDDPDAKISAAEALAQDVTIAIEAAVNDASGALHSYTTACIVEDADFDGSEGDISAQWGVAALSVSVTLQARNTRGL